MIYPVMIHSVTKMTIKHFKTAQSYCLAIGVQKKTLICIKWKKNSLFDLEDKLIELCSASIEMSAVYNTGPNISAAGAIAAWTTSHYRK